MDFVIKDGVLDKYCGNNSVVVIPNEVHSIDWYAFKNCKNIKSVIIHEDILNIEPWAFAECSSLESVQILGKATLGKGAFYKCSALRELKTPQGLEKIADSAFMGCKSLNSDLLDGMTFELHTLIGERKYNDITYPEDEEICLKAYSWDEYKKITSATLDYALIYSTEEYDELVGPVIPTLEEVNKPVSDEIILVRDKEFIGCLIEEERVYFYKGCERRKIQVILRPTDKDLLIFYMNGDHTPISMYAETKASLRRCDGNQWVDGVNSVHKTVLE